MTPRCENDKKPTWKGARPGHSLTVNGVVKTKIKIVKKKN